MATKTKTRRNRTKKATIFPRAAAMQFARFCMDCGSMADAAAECRRVAESLPATVSKNPAKPRRGWQEEFLRLAVALESGLPIYDLIKATGNQKLPFYAWSVLPIVTCPGFGKCAEKCYSLKAWQYPAAFMRQCQNTLFLRFNKRAIIDAVKAVPTGTEDNPTIFRLYVDGDFDSIETLGFWMTILRQRPDIQCFGYSKSWPILASFPRHLWPKNYVLNVSNLSRHDDDEQLKAAIMSLPVARGRFLIVETASNWHDDGFGRFDKPEYHREVRDAAAAAGFGKVFSCNGQCGDCSKDGPVCGLIDIKIPIAIGAH